MVGAAPCSIETQQVTHETPAAEAQSPDRCAPQALLLPDHHGDSPAPQQELLIELLHLPGCLGSVAAACVAMRTPCGL